MPTGTGKTVSLLSLIVSYLDKDINKKVTYIKDILITFIAYLLHPNGRGNGENAIRIKISYLSKKIIKWL